MPRFLKGETIQRLSGSQKALRLALLGLASPVYIDSEKLVSDNAAEIGLLGSSAELAISACLYEILGSSGVIKSDGSYPTAAQALADFRKLLQSGVPKLSVLSKGVEDPTSHLSNIEKSTKTFRAIFTARAGGLHAGSGVSRDVAYLAAFDISDFLSLLGQSSKWKPYLREISVAPPLPKSRQLIAEELLQLIKNGSSAELTPALKSIFIVLPDLSENEPEWVGSLERVNIAPNQADIKVLLDSLQTASVGEICKVGQGTQSFPARIDNNAPGALPISFLMAKKAFNKPIERWRADLGKANGVLDQQKRLDLPSIQSIYEYFALTPEQIGISDAEIERGISAQEAWPFIASSLDYQGTPGPCFFVARMIMEGEIQQLIAHLERASAHSRNIKSKLDSYIPLLENLQNSAAVLRSNSLANDLVIDFQIRTKNREQLMEKVLSRLNSVSEVHQDSVEIISEIVTSGDSLSGLFQGFSQGNINIGDAPVNPVLRLLIDSVTERDEALGLVELLLSNKFPQIATNIRKALRTIDFAVHGPMTQGGYDE